MLTLPIGIENRKREKRKRRDRKEGGV